MARILQCPECKTKYNISSLPTGAKFICKKCKKLLIVPDNTDSTLTSSNITGIQNLISEAKQPLPSSSSQISGYIIGNCRLIKKIGKGGMGIVYLAKHLRLDCEVAVKILSPELTSDPRFIERFVKEARLAAKLRHPNIVQVFDVGQDKGHYYIIEEFIDGGNLSELLKSNNKIPESTIWKILEAITSALEISHEHNIIHRDIKPANIMVTKRGEFKLADLGLAKQLDSQEASITMTNVTMGTPFYMSPEQIKDPKKVDERSDIYSLGATIYHLATGKPLFEGESVFDIIMKHIQEQPIDPAELRPELSKQLREIILKMVEKDPKKRYQSAKELMKAIKQAQTFLSTQTIYKQDTISLKRISPNKKKKIIYSITAIGGILTILFLWYFIFPSLYKSQNTYSSIRENGNKKLSHNLSFTPSYTVPLDKYKKYFRWIKEIANKIKTENQKDILKTSTLVQQLTCAAMCIYLENFQDAINWQSTISHSIYDTYNEKGESKYNLKFGNKEALKKNIDLFKIQQKYITAIFPDSKKFNYPSRSFSSEDSYLTQLYEEASRLNKYLYNGIKNSFSFSTAKKLNYHQLRYKIRNTYVDNPLQLLVNEFYYEIALLDTWYSETNPKDANRILSEFFEEDKIAKDIFSQITLYLKTKIKLWQEILNIKLTK